MRPPALLLICLVSVVACTDASTISTIDNPGPTMSRLTTTAGAYTTNTTLSTTTAPSTAPSPDEPIASGSGCTPDSEQLLDGDWYGFVVDGDTESVTFDLACWFSGEDAVLASAADGEESPPPNDYYIRNQNQLTRVIPVVDGLDVVWYPTGDPASESTVSYSEWLTENNWSSLGVWLEIENGAIVSLAEKWVP